MKKLLTRLMPLVVIAFAASLTVQAQGFYDDDIYYDASKAKKEKQEKAVEAARKAARANYIPSGPVTDYPGADTYVVNSGSTRDVDEYNRRYTVDSSGREVTDSVSLDQLTGSDFANTRRIERFSNPDIVSGSGDGELMDYYYASQSQPSTTVIINNVDPWYYGGIYSPWYNGYYSYNPWRWGWSSWYPGYYDPWFGPSWSWGWGPSWSWSWGWGGGWHHPGWGPGWGHPGHGPIWSGNTWRPSSPGASRPHSAGGVTPSVPGRRPGNSYYGGGSSRPAYTLPSGSNTVVPGSRVNPSSGRRPSAVNSGSPTSGSGYRNSGTVSGSRANQGRSSFGNSYNNNTNNSGSSWNSGSRNSGSSWGGGSGTRGGGGGGRSSGGGRSGRH